MKGTVEQLKQALVPIAPIKERGEQLKVNCPRCENELGMDVDKFNLEINYNKNAFKCWACGQHGNLELLVKKYGYKEFIDLFKSHEYQVPDEEQEEVILELPKHCMNVLNVPLATKYLIEERGLNKEKIKERNIKFCYAGDYKDCIIFPSYDSLGKLNGFVSHNLGTKKYKKRKAKDFVCFYESFIDKRSLIIITEGVYDALVLPNSLPLLGISVDEKLLDFLADTNILIALDNDISDQIYLQIIELFKQTCSIEIFNYPKEYKDPNEMFCEKRDILVDLLKGYYI